jgi:hypothetical protein
VNPTELAVAGVGNDSPSSLSSSASFSSSSTLSASPSDPLGAVPADLESAERRRKRR